ncbi:hypothetical protein B0H13DRAFT_2306320 [Mycena leptocephala]|nr:hypothetical protein B0H13DRAFT_2306320 [Mycena leptocephala]
MPPLLASLARTHACAYSGRYTYTCGVDINIRHTVRLRYGFGTAPAAAPFLPPSSFQLPAIYGLADSAISRTDRPQMLNRHNDATYEARPASPLSRSRNPRVTLKDHDGYSLCACAAAVAWVVYHLLTLVEFYEPVGSAQRSEGIFTAWLRWPSSSFQVPASSHLADSAISLTDRRCSIDTTTCEARPASRRARCPPYFLGTDSQSPIPKPAKDPTVT